MATDMTSRASMDIKDMQSADPARDRQRRANTCYESMRKTAGEAAIERYAAANPAINTAMTQYNWDFVNDGNGNLRTAKSIDEVVDYGTARRDRLSRAIKGELSEDGTTGVGERHALTVVHQLPWYLLEEDGTTYHPLGKDGLPKDGKDGRPLETLPRYRIRPDMADEAKRYVAEVISFDASIAPGGIDSIHGGSLNLDEYRPHLQLIQDTFYDNPRGKNPDALQNGYSLMLGRHPKDLDNFPLMRMVDKKTKRPILDDDGNQKMGKITAGGKKSLYHRRLKEHMIEKGFAIEAERDPVRHDRRVAGDNVDYGDMLDKRREVEALEQSTLADLGSQMTELDAEQTLATIDLIDAHESAAENGFVEGLSQGEAAAVARTAALDQREAGLDEHQSRIDAQVVRLRAQFVKERDEIKADRAAVESEKADAFRQGYGEGLRNGREDAEAQATAIVATARTEATGITDAATAQAQTTARLQRERLEREEAEAREQADERVRDYEAAERAKVPPYDPERANETMAAAKLDTMRKLKGAPRKDGSARTVDEWVDEKTAEVYARIGRPAPTETMGERTARADEVFEANGRNRERLRDMAENAVGRDGRDGPGLGR